MDRTMNYKKILLTVNLVVLSWNILTAILMAVTKIWPNDITSYAFVMMFVAPLVSINVTVPICLVIVVAVAVLWIKACKNSVMTKKDIIINVSAAVISVILPIVTFLSICNSI